jgi:alanine dehydrogenase
MKPGSVLVDIAVDQGGCFEGSKPTTHADPTFAVHNSVYYCVANMPGAVPVTSTVALTNATLRHVVALATHGWKQALSANAGLANGLNTTAGLLTNEPVGVAHGLTSVSVASQLV